MNRNDFCKPIQYESRFFYTFKKPTPLSLMERLQLAFVKEKQSEDKETGFVLVTKTLRGKVYVIREYLDRKPGYMCRHNFPKT